MWQRCCEKASSIGSEEKAATYCVVMPTGRDEGCGAIAPLDGKCRQKSDERPCGSAR